MNEFDDILENTNISNNNKGNNDNKNYNNNWQVKQNKLRQDAYDTMEKMSLVVREDSEKFKQYLDIQSRFEKYSVGNCLLVLAKQPNAMQFKDRKSWKEKGIELISNPKGIIILEPSRSETNNRVYYNPKEVFDITQTNAPKQDKVVNYSDRELLQAFLNNCIIPRKAVDELPTSKLQGAEYNKDDNILYVCRGMDREKLFQTLSQELANIEMKYDEDGNFKSFKSYCISYMLCQRYGVDVSNYDISELPEEIMSKANGKEVRAELDKIRVDFEKINSRVAEYFENSTREKKTKAPER